MGLQVVEKQRYRKHGAYYYLDEKTITLPFPAKSIGSYTLVSQVNRVGIFTFSVGLAQEELGLSPKVFNPNFDLVLNTFGWKFDRAMRVLYVPTWWRYNAPENPNVLVGALEDLNGLPKTPLLNEFAANVGYLPPNLHETFTQRMGERYGERLAIQESAIRSSLQQQKTPPNPPGVEGMALARFEEFRKAYPARGGMKLGMEPARVKFLKLSPDDQLQCIAATKAYAKGCANGERKPKDPDHFLEQDGCEPWRELIPSKPTPPAPKPPDPPIHTRPAEEIRKDLDQTTLGRFAADMAERNTSSTEELAEPVNS